MRDAAHENVYNASYLMEDDADIADDEKEGEEAEEEPDDEETDEIEEPDMI